MEYIIRKCEKNDLPILVKLCQNHAEYEQASYNPMGKQELLERAIFSDSPQLFCYIIECKEKVTGYFSYTFDFSTWDANRFLYMDCLYLEPESRGFKIGEGVIEKLKEIARQYDCINIQWQTPVFNDRAIKFYNRIGGTGKSKMRFFIGI